MWWTLPWWAQHSCREPIFGLCAIGFVHPARVWRKSGASVGDVLMLSKPIGTGVLLSEHLPVGSLPQRVPMCVTNKDAATALKACGRPPSAVTDVTGYGLLGHASEVAERSRVALTIDADRVPLLPGAREASARGTRTGNDAALSAGFADQLPTDLAAELRQLLLDPQTSGGLLAAVDPSDVADLSAHGFVTIGAVRQAAVGRVVVQ